MNTLEQQLRNKIDAFSKEISDLVFLEARSAVLSRLGEGGVAELLKKTAAPAKAAPAAAAKAPKAKRATGGGRKGARRTTEDFEAQGTKVLDFLRSHPGSRAEEIKKATGLAPSELSPVVKKLVASGKVKHQGEKRARTYTAA